MLVSSLFLLHKKLLLVLCFQGFRVMLGLEAVLLFPFVVFRVFWCVRSFLFLGN